MIKLLDYQRQYVDQIKHLYCSSDHKHISVAMKAGTGKSVILFQIIKELQLNNIAIICDGIARREYLKHNEMLRNEILGVADPSITIFTTHEIMRSDAEILSDFSVVFFYQLQFDDIALVEDKFVGYAGKTISFFDYFQQIHKQDKYSVSMDDSCLNKKPNKDQTVPFAEEKNIVLSFCSDVIDIRMYKSDKGLDASRFNADVVAQSASYLADNQRLSADVFALKQQLFEKDQEINDLMSSDVVDLKNELLRLQKENEKFKKEKSALEDKIEINRQTIAMLKSLLVYAGVPENDLKKAITSLRDIVKAGLSEKQSGNITEEEYGKLVQDKAAENYQLLSSRIISHKEKSDYERLLIACIGQDSWNKLYSKSKDFLVSAEHIMYSFVNSDRPDDWDYSGACLLVTKALELEAVKRFYSLYKQYLTNNNIPKSSWPKTANISYDEITLGTLAYIAGYETKSSTQPIVDDENLNKLFIAYARSYLYVNNGNVERTLYDDILFIEKVRNDYRNPAAHKGSMCKQDAEDCIQYVVEIQQRLRVMLENMRV